MLLAIMLAVAGFVDEAAFVIFVLFTQDVLGLAPVFYGLLFAAGAVGGIFGSFVMDGIVRRLGSGGTVLLSLAAGAVSYVGIALAAFSPAGIAVVAAMMVVNGFHLASWNIVTLSLRQRIVPGHLLGRVNSAYRFVAMVGLTVGTLVGGAVAAVFGLVAPYWLAAGLLISLTLVALAALRSGAFAEPSQGS